ncbi:hypothetical protein SHI21_19885 [Bacteriovorax sp. PP10]|uniref:DM13 domain-containing protein n=1 Tax=Bacteriovorax antarcticus TaxID=3088717 RepID=A0ABU5VZL8_9BACT|nr:hypothetical protein [Bacteriovorax sp. PP10]MEA9358507.1 hypothetical protein [Bacteriovorax sp. PP10]
MKSLLVLATLLVSTATFADTACNANYAGGLGHLFKGETRELGTQKYIKSGEKLSDELYTLSLSTNKKGELVKKLTETKTGKVVKLTKVDLGAGHIELFSTASLEEVYPSGVPGSYDGHNFILVMCGDESNF